MPSKKFEGLIFSIVLTPELKEQIAAEAKEQTIPRSAVVRQALKHYFLTRKVNRVSGHAKVAS